MNKLGKFAVALAMAFSVGAASAESVINVPAGATAADINAAIQAVDVGGTVNLAEGTYTIDASILLNRGVTLKGAGRDATTLDGKGGRFRGVTLSNADAVLADLTVTKCAGITTNGTGGGGILMSAGTVVNCHITANSLAQYNSFGAGINMTGGRVLNSIIDKNLSNANGGPTHSGGGIYMTAGLVEGCLIADNQAAKAAVNYNDTVGARTSTYGGGVYMSGASKLVNCTVYGNWTRRNGGGVYVSGTTAKVVNCLIAGNACEWATSATSKDCVADASVLDHCIIGGAPADHAADGWAFVADPAKGDYALTANSSAIGTGTAEWEFVSATDLAGNPRVHDGTADIGCLTVAAAPVCGIGCDRRVAVVGSTVILRALRRYGAEGAAIWTVTAPDGSTSSPEGDEAELTFDQVGVYSVSLELGGAAAVRDDFVSAPLTNYVSAAATSPEYPFDTPEKATTSLKDAVAAATDGSVIKVSGTVKAYDVLLDRDITVSGDGEGATVDGCKTSRVFDLNSPNARVEDLTIRNGKLAGSLNYQGGAGARIGYRGGTVMRCRLIDNQSEDGSYYLCAAGVLMVKGRLSHSVVTGSRTKNEPGGGVVIYGGEVDNCLIYGNKAVNNGQSGGRGGGVFIAGTAAKLRNCTIVDNESTVESGGGIYFNTQPSEAQVVNCLIVENTANSQGFADGKPDWAMQTVNDAWRASAAKAFVNCAFETCDAIGEGSVKVSAPFVDAPNKDYHVLGSSKSVEAGCPYEGMSETDLDGKPRVSGEAPDIGCYEVDKNVFAPTFDVDPVEVMAGSTVRLTPDLQGAPEGVTLGCRWTLTNGAGYSFVTEGTSLEQVFDHGGRYTIKLEVLDAVKGTKITEYIREDVLLVAVPVVYVTSKIDEATPVEPFDTPATASTNLSEVVDRHVIDGCQVKLDAGTHYLQHTLELTKGVTVSGADSAMTFVRRGRGFVEKSRTLHVNHADAKVEKVTFCGSSANAEYNTWGANCCIGSSGGTVSHCVISNNEVKTLYSYGIGIAVQGKKGLVSHCLIADNRVVYHHNVSSHGSVTMKAGRMDNCVVRNNRVDGEAGLYLIGSAQVYNCTVVGNVSTNFDNTTQTPNTTGSQSAHNGLRICDDFGSELDYDTFRVRNCIFANNVGLKGDYGSEFGYSAVDSRKTKPPKIPTNCLFKFDDPAVSVGTKCVNGDPMFVDAAAHDYHVRGRSPAKKKGKIESWMRDDACFETDFGGDPRLVQPYHMDMGAYETDPIGFKLLVK